MTRSQAVLGNYLHMVLLILFFLSLSFSFSFFSLLELARLPTRGLISHGGNPIGENKEGREGGKGEGNSFMPLAGFERISPWWIVNLHCYVMLCLTQQES